MSAVRNCPEMGDEPHYFAFIASIGGRVCVYCGTPEPDLIERGE